MQPVGESIDSRWESEEDFTSARQRRQRHQGTRWFKFVDFAASSSAPTMVMACAAARSEVMTSDISDDVEIRSVEHPTFAIQRAGL